MKLRPIYRITVFVPRDHLHALVEGVRAVYPLGDEYYDSVLWYLEDAREQFRPLQGAMPARGQHGELHEEAVSMLVFSLPRDESILSTVIENGVRAHHPWEAPGLFIEESWTVDYFPQDRPLRKA